MTMTDAAATPPGTDPPGTPDATSSTAMPSSAQSVVAADMAEMVASFARLDAVDMPLTLPYRAAWADTEAGR